MSKALHNAAAYLFTLVVPWYAGAQPKGAIDIPDLTKIAQVKPLLEKAAEYTKKYAQGNESGVSIKSASAKNVTFDLKTFKPNGGTVTVVFDLHHRHRTTKDGGILGLPGIIAYDRHDEIVAEYDIATARGRARIAKGPLGLPQLPVIDWELWVNMDPMGK